MPPIPIHVPRPQAVIYHPDGHPWSVLLNDSDGNQIARVMFNANDEVSKELAYAYYTWKGGQ
jgi:hypothetical protein